MKVSRLLWTAALVALPAAAFAGAYIYTGKYFREQLIALPFEKFGIAAGLGAACWTIAVLVWLRSQFVK